MKYRFRWLQKIRFFEKEKNKVFIANEIYQQTGKQLKEERERQGISRNQLSIKTKITPAIIESIEEGWIDKLPEEAYLISMLEKIEDQLRLNKGTLDCFVRINSPHRKDGSSTKIDLSNIDILTTWKGNIIYVVVLAISIYALNYSQRKIAISSMESINPIAPNSNSLTKSSSKPKIESSITRLKEIEGIEPYSIRIKFINFLERLVPFVKEGVLEVRTTDPVTISIDSAANKRIMIYKLKGSIEFKLIPPIKLEADLETTDKFEIYWRGKKYSPKNIDTGIYLIRDKKSNNYR